MTPGIARLTLMDMARDSNDEGGDAFPRAPTQEEWDRMSAEERAEVVESLPSEISWEQWAQVAALPEGDLHTHACREASLALGDYFTRARTRVYVGSNLGIYYPGEHVFSPDVLVVKDVEGHLRQRWVVSTEGKGLDWVLEVHAGGDRKKDTVRNIELYARLRIPEYFIYDRGRQRLDGFRLASSQATSYQPIEPHNGRYDSVMLGLTLEIVEGHLRFWADGEMLPHHEELVSRLDVETRRREDAEQRLQEESRRREEESRRREDAERRLAALQAVLKGLKEGRG